MFPQCLFCSCPFSGSFSLVFSLVIFFFLILKLVHERSSSFHQRTCKTLVFELGRKTLHCRLLLVWHYFFNNLYIYWDWNSLWHGISVKFILFSFNYMCVFVFVYEYVHMTLCGCGSPRTSCRSYYRLPPHGTKFWSSVLLAKHVYTLHRLATPSPYFLTHIRLFVFKKIEVPIFVHLLI